MTRADPVDVTPVASAGPAGCRCPVLHAAIARQCGQRHQSPTQIGIKINLYRGYEVQGLAHALRGEYPSHSAVECLMVADSYFMTHLGRSSTRLAEAEHRWGMDVMAGLVAEVAAASKHYLLPGRPLYLIADLPDGACEHPETMLRAAERFLDAGADVVKVEAGVPQAFRCVEEAARRGIPTMLHLGYSPQHTALARRGQTAEEAIEIFADARRARDAGACALVLEMVSEIVNRALSWCNPRSIPVYSVFSGWAPYGGQSLNVWDAVIKPSRPRKYFPPTAVLPSTGDLTRYTPELIGDRLAALIRLTLSGDFPPTPRASMDPADVAALREVDPWSPPS